MEKPDHPIHEEPSPAFGTGRAPENIWRSYREQLSIAFRNSPFRRALMQAFASLELRQVRHVTFEQLSAAGYDIRLIEDGASTLDPTATTRRDLPKSWGEPLRTVTPKVATLRNALLFKDGSALLPDGSFIFLDITVPRRVWRRLDTLPFRTMRFIGKNDDALIPRHIGCIEVPGRCFSTRSDHPRNFGHFVQDVLSRIYYEDLGVIIPGRDKVIAPKLYFPMQEALFRKVYEGYEIVQVPPEIPLRVEELLLPANLCHMDDFNSAAIAALAKRMRRIAAPYVGLDKRKVCASRRDGRLFQRKDNQRRNFVNVDAYETRMRELGYEVVTVASLDPEAQYALWANTTDIVGIHGSGLINTIMMPSGGNYTEILAKPEKTTFMRHAMATGHQVGGLAEHAESVEMQGLMEIDLCRLEALLLDAS